MRSLNVVLILMLMVFSIALVKFRHASRVHFVELQALNAQRDELNIEWRQLQLEKRTQANHSRIEKRAREELKMSIPEPEDLVIVTQVRADR